MATGTADRLREVRDEIHASYGFWGADDPRRAVRAALAQRPPRGAPGVIRAVAANLAQAAAAADRTRLAVTTAGQDRLPEVWLGRTALRAGDVLAALAEGCARISDQVERCAGTLRRLADDLDRAQRLDASGRGLLRHADDLLQGATGWRDYDGHRVTAAHHAAMTGVDALAEAAGDARRAGTDAARDLHQSASTAHAGRMRGTGNGAALGPADEVVVGATVVGTLVGAGDVIPAAVMAETSVSGMEFWSPMT